jgi:hypothetical protein
MREGQQCEGSSGNQMCSAQGMRRGGSELSDSLRCSLSAGGKQSSISTEA